jgi:hypothetical protein
MLYLSLETDRGYTIFNMDPSSFFQITNVESILFGDSFLLMQIFLLIPLLFANNYQLRNNNFELVCSKSGY